MYEQLTPKFMYLYVNLFISKNSESSYNRRSENKRS